jgi:hypothetical protein
MVNETVHYTPIWAEAKNGVEDCSHTSKVSYSDKIDAKSGSGNILGNDQDQIMILRV